MFNNVGTVDRLIRLVLASALFYFGLLVLRSRWESRARSGTSQYFSVNNFII